MHATSIKLAGFIALSLVAHGALFLSQSYPQPRPMSTPFGMPTLSVTLSAAESVTDSPETYRTLQSPTTASTQQYASTKIEQDSSHSSTQQTTRLPEAFHSNDTIPGPAISNTQQAVPDTTTSIAQRNFLLGRIRHRLSRYLSYPTRARRRGWEGEVMIGFYIDRQGYLHNIHLTQTSGFTLLDNAALNAIEKMNSAPLSPGDNQSWDTTFYPIALQLPVTYRLTNS